MNNREIGVSKRVAKKLKRHGVEEGVTFSPQEIREALRELNEQREFAATQAPVCGAAVGTAVIGALNLTTTGEADPLFSLVVGGLPGAVVGAVAGSAVMGVRAAISEARVKAGEQSGQVDDVQVAQTALKLRATQKRQVSVRNVPSVAL